MSPHRKSKEQIQKERREIISKTLIRLLGIAFVIGGVIKELYHIISKSVEPLWGTLFGIQIHTSSVLIFAGILTIALSFQKVMNWMKNLNIFRKK